MLWGCKLLAVVSLSIGLSLLLLPFPDHLAGENETGIAQSTAVPWLSGAARIAGAISLLVGLVLMVGSYRAAGSRSGIPIGSVPFTVFCDLVLVAFGVFAVGVTIDAAWVELGGQASLLGLEPEWPSDQTFTGIHFVALPAVFIALPLLTLAFTAMSSQRVRVDGEGATVLGAIGATSISWDELEEVRIREQRNPASFTVTDFRSLQRVLELTGGDRTLTINEPTSRARKRAIISALRSHVPPGKTDLFDAVEKW